MENKRAGFSFKAVGVVGFVILTFLLIRLLRLPEGAVLSDMMPNFMMLLLGVLVLGSSFILLALGRIVELLQNFRSTHTLLSEIREETERVRIESQYIYEVQKDTLVKLTNINEAAQNGAMPNLASDMQSNNKQTSANEVAKATISPETSPAISKTNTASGTTSRGASFAASRLSKNIEQGKITPITSEQDGFSGTTSDFKAGADADIRANTDESTWSSLVGQNDSTIQTNQSNPKDSLISSSKVANLPVSDADYDRAAVDGSDDIVDAIAQPKVWKPLADDELISEDLSQKDLSIKGEITEVSEVSDAEISESLDAAVVDLKSEADLKSDFEVNKRNLQENKSQEKWSEKEKPVFEDRLSQTEKNIETNKISPDNAVRFGSFPATKENKADEGKPDFTLEDITGETFSKDSLDSTQTSDNFVQNNDDVDSLEKVFSNVNDRTETSNNHYAEGQSFASNNNMTSGFGATEGFGNTEDGFETAEDSFDDIREVFDTQAKQLASDVNDMTETPTTKDRIKESLKRASGRVSGESSDVGKNLN